MPFIFAIVADMVEFAPIELKPSPTKLLWEKLQI